MLQILNSTERNQAFLKFLLFFLITVSLIITAVYFNFRMPRKENALLKSEVQVSRQQDANQGNFAAILAETEMFLDSLDKPNSNVQHLDGIIINKINQLNALQPTLSSEDARVHELITSRILNFHNQHKQLRTLRSNLDKLQGEYNKCDKELQYARQFIPREPE